MLVQLTFVIRNYEALSIDNVINCICIIFGNFSVLFRYILLSLTGFYKFQTYKLCLQKYHYNLFLEIYILLNIVVFEKNVLSYRHMF